MAEFHLTTITVALKVIPLLFYLYDIQNLPHNDDSFHSVSSANFVGMVFL